MANKYEQIYLHLKGQIQEGKYKIGDKMPSIRQLAESFSVSKNTITKALLLLEQEHMIYVKKRSGYYVVEHTKTENERVIIDFLSAGPDTRVLPYEDFQHCLNQAIYIYKEQLFTYNDYQGLRSLRETIAKYLQKLQVFTKAEQLVMTSGSQQILHILSLMPLPNMRNKILVENPTYFGMLQALQSTNTEVVSINIFRNDNYFTELEQIFADGEIKFFYLIPRCHNPLGHQYSNTYKKKILALANQYDVYIVEDDYLAELDANKKNDPFFALDSNERVLYIKSFSKVFLPGLRLATVALPKKLVQSFIQYKFSHDFNTSSLSQGALDIYLKSGMFDYHIERARKLYDVKLRQLIDACEQYLPNSVQWTAPLCGFYLTIFLPRTTNMKRLLKALSEKHILVKDARDMFVQQNDVKALRLSISQVDETKISEGIQQLALLIEKNSLPY